MICPACQKEIPDDSTFCLSCGRPINAVVLEELRPPEGSSTDGRATIYWMLAFMFLFFGGFLLFPGYFVGMGMMIPAISMIVVGVILLVARHLTLRRYAKSMASIRGEAFERGRCSYCGTLNPASAEKCESCGAAL